MARCRSKCVGDVAIWIKIQMLGLKKSPTSRGESGRGEQTALQSQRYSKLGRDRHCDVIGDVNV